MDTIPPPQPQTQGRPRPARGATNGAWSACCCPTCGNTTGGCWSRSLFLVSAKLANVGVPLVLKADRRCALARAAGLLAVPLALLVAYGVLRLSTALFTELRDIVFAQVTQRAMRRVALRCSATCTRCRCASTSSARPAA